MPIVSAQVAAKRYRDGIAGAGTKYQDGIDQAENWEQGYIREAPKMERRLISALQAGRHIDGVRKISHRGWQEKTKAKSANYVNSAGEAGKAYEAVASSVITAAQAGRDAANAVDPSRPDAWKERMIANAIAIARSWGKEL
jgi:hypothetical protein